MTENGEDQTQYVHVRTGGESGVIVSTKKDEGIGTRQVAIIDPEIRGPLPASQAESTASLRTQTGPDGKKVTLLDYFDIKGNTMYRDVQPQMSEAEKALGRNQS